MAKTTQAERLLEQALAEERKNLEIAKSIIQAEHLVVHDSHWASQPDVLVRCGTNIDTWGARAAINSVYAGHDPLVFKTAVGTFYTFRDELATCFDCDQKNPAKPAACVVVVEWNGRFLAVTRRDKPGTVCFPGGKRELGEDPETCARRELLEETGIMSTSLVLMGDGVDDVGWLTRAYRATDWNWTTSGFGPDAHWQNEPGIECSWKRPEEFVGPNAPYAKWNRARFLQLNIPVPE